MVLLQTVFRVSAGLAFGPRHKENLPRGTSILHCRLYFAYRLGWHLGRAIRRIFREARQSFRSSFRSSEDGFQHAGRTLIALILVSMPVLVAVVIGRVERSLNCPSIFAAAFFLVILLRGPLSEIPWFLKKALKLEILMCLLAGFVMLLDGKLLWSFLDPFGLTRNQTGFHLILAAVCIWLAGVSWIIFSRPKRK